MVVRPKYGLFLHILFLTSHKLNYIWKVPKKFAQIVRFGHYHYNNHVILLPERGRVVLFDPKLRRVSGHLNYDRYNCRRDKLLLLVEGKFAVLKCHTKYVRIYRLIERKTNGYIILDLLIIRTLRPMSTTILGYVVVTNTADVVAIKENHPFVVYRRNRQYIKEAIDEGDMPCGKRRYGMCTWDRFDRRLICSCNHGLSIEINCRQFTATCMKKKPVIFHTVTSTHFASLDHDGDMMNIVLRNDRLIALHIHKRMFEIDSA